MHGFFFYFFALFFFSFFCARSVIEAAATLLSEKWVTETNTYNNSALGSRLSTGFAFGGPSWVERSEIVLVQCSDDDVMPSARLRMATFIWGNTKKGISSY